MRRWRICADRPGVSGGNAPPLLALLKQAGLVIESEGLGRRDGDLVIVWRAHGAPARHAEAAHALLGDPLVTMVEVSRT